MGTRPAVLENCDGHRRRRRIGEAICTAWVLCIFGLFLLQFRSIIEIVFRQFVPS